MSVSVQIRGLDDVIRKARTLSQKTVQEAITDAMPDALQPVLSSAQQKCPVESGTLKKSLGVKVKKYPSGKVWGAVGPRKGYRAIINRTHKINGKTVTTREKRDAVAYAHLVELGHRKVLQPKRSSRLLPVSINASRQAARRAKYQAALAAGSITQGQNGGNVKPHPFLRPALNERGEAVKSIMASKLSAWVKSTGGAS